ncbi:MAG TPA: hypothetical protein VI138_08050 [Candidatus Dormibacteraeota bacterium]
MGRVKSILALVGACAAASIVVPPVAGLLNGIGSVALLGLAGYAAYRAWAWLESVVEASRRPTTVRRNLSRTEPDLKPGPTKAPTRSRARPSPEASGPAKAERRLAWPVVVRIGQAEPDQDPQR